MSLTDKLLVDMSVIKERVSEFDKNISPNQLKYSTLTSQDQFTRDILGDKLYFDILDGYDVQTGQVAPLYQNLYEYIKQHLIARVCERSLFIIHNQITNKGLQNRQSDYSSSASDTNLFRMVNLYKRDAEFYEKRLWNYLKNNKEDYPLWEEKSDDINKKRPDEDFGIFII